jgi:magnesium-transporting ATPase (P-type)
VAYAGCFVVEGEARAHLTSTGAHTRRAAIATLTQAQRLAPTPLRLELARFHASSPSSLSAWAPCSCLLPS